MQCEKEKMCIIKLKINVFFNKCMDAICYNKVKKSEFRVCLREVYL